ncbi:hypothetical protein niasHT_014375 [Heterodera trifolii]|uniref:Collagenase NC10/endostatin domain-containing protein n=1 Tax=Heterodera trifolii TaxID=157864 RepID=A0ABD2LHG3_9BILA
MTCVKKIEFPDEPNFFCSDRVARYEQSMLVESVRDANQSTRDSMRALRDITDLTVKQLDAKDRLVADKELELAQQKIELDEKDRLIATLRERIFYLEGTWCSSSRAGRTATGRRRPMSEAFDRTRLTGRKKFVDFSLMWNVFVLNGLLVVFLTVFLFQIWTTNEMINAKTRNFFPFFGMHMHFGGIQIVQVPMDDDGTEEGHHGEQLLLDRHELRILCDEHLQSGDCQTAAFWAEKLLALSIGRTLNERLPDIAHYLSVLTAAQFWQTIITLIERHDLFPKHLVFAFFHINALFHRELYSEIIALPVGYLIHLIALNEPLLGNFGGVRGADLECYRQSRQAGFGTTFRAFVSSRVQDLNKIVYAEDRQHTPVVNLAGERLFDSWHGVFDGGAHAHVPLYTFDRRNVFDHHDWSDRWLWHGSSSGGLRSLTYCAEWRSAEPTSFGMASPLHSRHALTDQSREMPCNRRLAVLCVEVMSKHSVQQKFGKRMLSDFRV